MFQNSEYLEKETIYRKTKNALFVHLDIMFIWKKTRRISFHDSTGITRNDCTSKKFRTILTASLFQVINSRSTNASSFEHHAFVIKQATFLNDEHAQRHGRKCAHALIYCSDNISMVLNLPTPGIIWNESFSSVSTAPVTILTLGNA